MASITIKTPKRSITLKASQKKQIEFFSELENNVSKVCLGRLSNSIEKNYEDQIAVIATFFQRVIARTPLDERYERVITTSKGEQKIIKHVPDGEICREHWYIEEAHGGNKLYSRTLIKGGLNFDVVNDSAEINAIKDKLRTKYPLKRFLKANEEASFTVANDCKHFTRLEYGFSSWKRDSSPIVGESGREHGVTNKHSVQAPVGMLRITEAELDSIRRKPSLKGIRSRYKGGTALKATPSDKKLKEFYKLLKKSHRVRYADIKRYLEEY